MMPTRTALCLTLLLFAPPSRGEVPFDLELRFLPSAPRASDPLLVVLEGFALNPHMRVEVEGTLMTVRFFEHIPAILPPPPEQFVISEVTRPLPVGTYSVEVRVPDEDEPVLTRELVVTAGGPSPTTIPTLSSAALAILAAVLVTIGMLAIHRRSPPVRRP